MPLTTKPLWMWAAERGPVFVEGQDEMEAEGKILDRFGVHTKLSPLPIVYALERRYTGRELTIGEFYDALLGASRRLSEATK